jgi:uncharacterized protein (TIGR02246 family)
MDYFHAIETLFEEWNEALQSGDPSRVTDLYAFNAVLVPTLSNRVRLGHAEIEDYFRDFLAKNPSGADVARSHIRVYGDTAINSGIYVFAFSPADKEPYSVRGRFTFVHHWHGDRWLIVEHHSSLMPEDGPQGERF